MDVGSDGVNCARASKLRVVKDMRERSAMRELSKAEASHRVAVLAVEQGLQQLAMAEERRAMLEVELYQQLISLEALSVEELDGHCRRVIEGGAADIALRRRTLDDALVAQKKAETAVCEARTCWAKCSAALRKWEQIEHDERRASEFHAELAIEMEADDEVGLRSRRDEFGELQSTAL